MNNLLRKIFPLTLMLVIILLMSACGSKQDESNLYEGTSIQDSESESDDTSQEGYEEQSAMKDELAIESCNYCSDYNDGVAWNIYSFSSDNRGFCVSVIDKTGKMLFSWDTGLLSYSYTSDEKESIPGFSCDNRYAYIEKDGKFYVVDISGKILYSCVVDSNNIILAYGEGYVIARNHHASFDSSGYTYTVYAPDGSVVSEKETDYVLNSVYYLGHGIFGYCLDEEINCHLFNAKSNTSSETRMETPILENASFSNDDSISYIGYDGNWNDGDIYFTYKFIDESGEIISVDLQPEDESAEKIMVSGEKCMLQTEAKLYIYDSNNQELKLITLPYEDKVMWDETFAFGENKIVVPVQGEDNRKYIMVVDDNGNLLMEPTLANQYTRFSDDRMVVTTDDDICVYDGNMNVAFTLSQMEYIDLDLLRSPINRDFYGLGEYSDGVAILSQWGGGQTHDKYLYLDTDGNILFDEIDTSNAVNLNLEAE